MEEDTRFELIESGSKLIKMLIKDIKKPVQKEAKDTITESIKTLDKKLKMLKKDESLRAQYLDRTAFDTIQGVFQALHLYIISTDEIDLIDHTVAWLRSHEDCYSIADRMQQAALTRAEFGGAKR